MRPTITAFDGPPDDGKGMARDMRVRWALEEVGQPYDVRLLPWARFKEPAHRALHPFGKIPTYEEGDLVLFETGAIVQHIAETRPGLFPEDAKKRARAIVWIHAALNTIEPPIVEREAAGLFESRETWFEQRKPRLEDAIRERLSELDAYLGERDWLEDAFTAGDLMMIMVLWRLNGMNLREEFPRVDAYVDRGAARPAFRRAYADQAERFEAERQ